MLEFIGKVIGVIFAGLLLRLAYKMFEKGSDAHRRRINNYVPPPRLISLNVFNF